MNESDCRMPSLKVYLSKISCLSKKISRIFMLIKHVRKSEIKWRNPPKSDIVIYDQDNAQVFYEYLGDYSVTEVSITGETLYFSVLLRSILRSKFWKLPIQTYVEEFLKSTQPKLIVTFTDNNPPFYELSNKFTSATTLLIQNGWRSNTPSLFSVDHLSRDYYVDYMLMFGHSIGSFYKENIGGNIICIGSMRSNKIPKSIKRNNKTVLFVSQVSKYPTAESMYLLDDGRTVTEEQFYAAEMTLLPNLFSWCLSNSFKLQICLRSTSIDEKRFYEQILVGPGWEFVEKSNTVSSYELVDEAEIVVAIDSTLGLESLGRDNKTAFFNYRKLSVNNWPDFFWPADLPTSGPFWTDVDSYSEVERILKSLSAATDEDWINLVRLHQPNLMGWDEGNKILMSTINSILKT